MSLSWNNMSFGERRTVRTCWISCRHRRLRHSITETCGHALLLTGLYFGLCEGRPTLSHSISHTNSSCLLVRAQCCWNSSKCLFGEIISKFCSGSKSQVLHVITISSMCVGHVGATPHTLAHIVLCYLPEHGCGHCSGADRAQTCTQETTGFWATCAGLSPKQLHPFVHYRKVAKTCLTIDSSKYSSQSELSSGQNGSQICVATTNFSAAPCLHLQCTGDCSDQSTSVGLLELASSSDLKSTSATLSSFLTYV